MRRFSAILAVLVLALVLTACGKDDDRNNGGNPSRPDTNQSQNAPQDNGSGGSWQNGTDTPAQPGAGENRRNGEDTLPGTQAYGTPRPAARRGQHRHLPADAGKRLRPRQRRFSQRRREHQLVADTYAAMGRREIVFPCAHLHFWEKGI